MSYVDGTKPMRILAWLLISLCVGVLPVQGSYGLPPLYYTQRACSAASIGNNTATRRVVVAAGLSYLSTVLSSIPAVPLQGQSDVLITGASHLAMVDMVDSLASDESSPHVYAGGGKAMANRLCRSRVCLTACPQEITIRGLIYVLPCNMQAHLTSHALWEPRHAFLYQFRPQISSGFRLPSFQTIPSWC